MLDFLRNAKVEGELYKLILEMCSQDVSEQRTNSDEAVQDLKGVVTVCG